MKAITAASLVAAITWAGLWLTPDQQAQQLFRNGDYEAAAETFQDPMWQGVSWYRAGEFEKAEAAFARIATPEAEFDRGNCLVFQGEYDAAIERYDRALELRPGWEDAQVNRDIAALRAERVRQTGGDMGNQTLGADEIVFDKEKGSEGQETQMEGQELTEAQMQAMWLRRVQTRPADFLKAKFAYQDAFSDEVSE